MKIIVAGAVGFIGVYLCGNLIQKGHEIIYTIDLFNSVYGTDLVVRIDKFTHWHVNDFLRLGR